MAVCTCTSCKHVAHCKDIAICECLCNAQGLIGTTTDIFTLSDIV